jgi:hypothetical protein
MYFHVFDQKVSILPMYSNIYIYIFFIKKKHINTLVKLCFLNKKHEKTNIAFLKYFFSPKKHENT